MRLKVFGTVVFTAVALSMLSGAGNAQDLDDQSGAALEPSLTTRKHMDDPDFKGRAHWYGNEFHGRRTASGLVFDKHKLTAAHPSLPFGTKVSVRSVHTGKTVTVTVIDRCPHMKQRCIDLSEGAAREIGIFPSAPGGVECSLLKTRKLVAAKRSGAHLD